MDQDKEKSFSGIAAIDAETIYHSVNCIRFVDKIYFKEKALNFTIARRALNFHTHMHIDTRILNISLIRKSFFGLFAFYRYTQSPHFAPNLYRLILTFLNQSKDTFYN